MYRRATSRAKRRLANARNDGPRRKAELLTPLGSPVPPVPPVHRDRVPVVLLRFAILKWLAVPSGPALGKNQAASQATRVVVAQTVTPAQLEARHQCPALGDMGRACLDEGGALGRGTEKRHVAGHYHDIKLTAQGQCRQVSFHPLQRRGTAPRLPDHRCVYVDAHNIHTVACQLDRHPPGAAPSVQNRRWAQRADQGRLTVDIGPLFGQSVEPGLVRPPVETRHGDIQPAGRPFLDRASRPLLGRAPGRLRSGPPGTRGAG